MIRSAAAATAASARAAAASPGARAARSRTAAAAAAAAVGSAGAGTCRRRRFLSVASSSRRGPIALAAGGSGSSGGGRCHEPSSSRTALAAAGASSASAGTTRVGSTMPRAAATSTTSTCCRCYSTTPIYLKDYPPHTLYPMPALSPTMESGSIAKWSIGPGDAFGAGDVICEIETDKATMDFEAQDDGVLAKILREGDGARDLKVGTPICVVVDEEEDVGAFVDFVAEEEPGAAAAAAEPAAAAPAEAPAAAAAVAAAPAAAAAPDREVAPEFALLPSARSLSQSRGVDATVLPGTGKGGRVTKGDVLKALKDGVYMPPLAAAGQAAAAAAAGAAAALPPPAAAAPVQATVPEITTDSTYEDVPNNNMRKVIARRLTESKSQVPHFYAAIEVELDEVMKLRKQLVSDHDVKVSVNDLIIRSSALALRDVPEVNATYDPKSNTVSVQDTIDISVAVATPTGLITPIVPRTDTMGLSDITDKVRDLATRARDGKLAPEEYQGGTFTISNLGMFGMDEFSAVINPPQAAILAVGGGTRKVVPGRWVDGLPEEEQEKPGIRTVMTARLSADRRVVDEATAAMFLSAFRHYLSKPELLML